MPPALVASFAFAVVPMSWGKWPDVLVDYGQQLYVPWRLSLGEVLSRDVAYLHGPLSQYAHAMLFRLFGSGFWTLALFNLALTALATALLYRLFARLSGTLSAVVASLLFLSLFAFAQLGGTGNYNWVTPYVHEITHGAVLSLGALLALARFDETGRARWAVAAGFLVGLAFLTKAEVFAAVAVACAAFLVVLRARAPRGSVAAFVAASVVPPLAAILLFATAMPLRDAERAALGPFRPDVLFGGAAENVFFLSKIGLTNPSAALRGVAVAAALLAALLVPAYLAARRVPPERATLAAAIAALLAACALAFLVPRVPVLGFSLPFPAVAVAVAIVAARRLARAPAEDVARRERLRLAFSIFALALLPKILLSCVVTHYGFVLAMPAVLLAADAAVSLVPAHLAERGGAPAVFRAPALTILAGIATLALALSFTMYAGKPFPVGSARDAFRADARGLYVDAALDALSRLAKPGETLAVVPEGATLNYLARLRNPTPYTNLMPPEMASFGEDRIVAAFQAHPPDLVAVVHKSTAEYGLPFFGRHYGRRLGAFLAERYVEVWRAGAPPLRDERFGIAILRRTK